MKLTDEQQAVVDAVRAGHDCKVTAVAGAGKSTTVFEAAKAVRGNVLYLVYNRAAADDARAKAGKNTEVRTVHSLAYERLGRSNAHRLPRSKWEMKKTHAPNGRPYASGRVTSQKTAQLLGLTGGLRIEDVGIQRQTIARIASETIDHFCYTSDGNILPKHVPRQPKISEAGQKELAEKIAPLARKIWKDTTRNPESEHRYTFEIMLKQWALTKPLLEYDAIMIDEAQDSNGLTLGLIQKQSCQKIAVGDSCQPTGTMVTVVTKPSTSNKEPAVTEQIPIEDLQIGHQVVAYGISQRHIYSNGKAVTGITRLPFAGNLVRITTDTGLTSAYTPNHHSVARLGNALWGKHMVYVMQKGDNFRIGVSSARMESQKGALGIMIRATNEDADAMWIAGVYDTRAEAVTQEAILGWTYGIPDLMFRSSGHTMGQEGLDAFWSKLGGNRTQAAALLSSMNRDINYPLWTKGETRLNMRRPMVLRACNLFDGMEVLPLSSESRHDGGAPIRSAWKPITVSHEPYVGDVWSMNVEDAHTYAGDGIFTHNCQQLYAWRGASDILDTWPGLDLTLSQSWRFGEAIAEQANLWLPHAHGKVKVVGNPRINSKVISGDPDPDARYDAILCRSNAMCVQEVMDLIDKGITPAIAGGTDQMRSLLNAAVDLKENNSTTHPELYVFTDWEEVQAYSEEPQGSDLKVLVKLVNRHGAKRLLWALSQTVDENSDKVECTVSTAHKSKGLEWDRVKIAKDFENPLETEVPDEGQSDVPPQAQTTHKISADGLEGPLLSRADAMLGYVAVTRAAHLLDNVGVSWIADLPVPVESH